MRGVTVSKLMVKLSTYHSCIASVLENTSCPSGDITRVKTQ